MAIYLKKFETQAAYEAAESSLILPNVSVCLDQPTVVHYNAYIEPEPPETMFVVKYNVTSTTQSTQLLSGYEQNIFKSMEVDGVQLSNIVTSYAFNSVGIHTVKYELYDETKLGNNAPIFNGYIKLIEAYIPDSVTTIGANAFNACTGLTSIIIPSGVTSIGSNAFTDCYIAIYNFVNNSSLDEAANNYWGCTILDYDIDGLLIDNNILIKYRGSSSSVTIPNTVTSIGNNAFYNCSTLTSITIPNSVTSIGNAAFQYCSGLTSIVIPNSVTNLGSSAFTQCNAITSCTIGSGVTSISERTFSGCTSLTSITIPDSVTSLGSHAFSYCNSITSITIGSGVTSIDYTTFYSCSSIISITVDNNNTVYNSHNNCNAIIETSTNKLILGCKNTVMPNNIVTISKFAFYNCSGLTSITIPDSVTSIDEYSFYGCTNLTSVNIPSGITKINSGVFCGCSGLTSIEIPSGITTINNNALAGCKGLTSIISRSATAPSIYATTFSDINTGGTLYVPIGSTGYDTWMQNANYYLGLYGWTKVEQ